MNNERKSSLARKLLDELKSARCKSETNLEAHWYWTKSPGNAFKKLLVLSKTPSTIRRRRSTIKSSATFANTLGNCRSRSPGKSCDRSSVNAMPSSKTKRRSKMQGHTISGFQTARAILRARAEAMYESALETLHELNGQSLGFDVFMDRPLCFDGKSIDVLTPDASGVPRLRDSRSQYNRYEHPPRMSVRRLKIEALVSRLDQLAYMR